MRRGIVHIALCGAAFSLAACGTESSASNQFDEATNGNGASTCQGVTFSGSTGGQALCNVDSGKPVPTSIQVNVTGPFGGPAVLHIDGPNGFSTSIPMTKDSGPCAYRANFDATKNGGAGTYTFTVEGNGNTASFTDDLHCPC
jgi:hypothetical protein